MSANSTFVVCLVKTFNGERRHTSKHVASSLAGLRQAVARNAPHDLGWGTYVEMSRTAAVAFGAYETDSGEWIIHTPELTIGVTVLANPYTAAEVCGGGSLRIYLQCDMSDTCGIEVTHVEDKGYVYCAAHAKDRKSYGHRVRLLKAAERKQLLRNEPLQSY